MEQLTLVYNLSNCRNSKFKLCLFVLFMNCMLVFLFWSANILFTPFGMIMSDVGNDKNVTCEKCFSASFDFSVDIPDLCHGDVEVVIGIHVSPDRLDSRQVIRNTWLSGVRGTSRYSFVRYFFLLGRPGDEETRRAVLNESRVYQDIVLAEFQDTYRNLTLKTVVYMKWLSTRCPDARYFLKTDDDVWVDVDYLLATLKQFKDTLRTSLGGVCRSVPVCRNTSNKWCASTSEFAGNMFDPYCSGTGYVGSLHLAKGVAYIYVKVPYFHLEDVYMGMCLKALGFGTVMLPHFDNTAGPDFSDCSIKSGGFVTIHKIPPDRMERIHKSTCKKTNSQAMRVIYSH